MEIRLNKIHVKFCCIIACCAGLYALFGGLVYAEQPLAPQFQVLDSADHSLSLDDLVGTASIILYETRETTEENRTLKEALKQLKQQGAVFKIVPIVDCSTAPALFKGMWKAQIRDHSVKEKVDIYCDWTGAFGRAYQSASDTSNIYIIDRTGRIVYRNAGTVPSSDMPKIKLLLEAVAAKD